MSALLRQPTVRDAADILRLVEGTGVLDVNSLYAYVLVCDHHAPTSVVAEEDGALLGFVSAYRPPVRPGVLFVWQVGVHASARGRGLATRMLLHLLGRPACLGARWIETTVTPSNTASQRLFHRLARALDTNIERSEGYPAELLGGDHEAEDLYRIGPFPRKN